MKPNLTPPSGLSDTILNDALDMSMTWGENWGKPINGRMQERYPEITDTQAEALQQWSRAMCSAAFALVEDGYQEAIAKPGGEDALRAALTAYVQQYYPQMSEGNISHLYSQGMYYAWHG
jgi:hypothetical protein